MRTINVYEPGDVVQVKDGWRDWLKGEQAEVCTAYFEGGGFSGLQVVRIVNENEHDFNTLYAYQVELVPAEESEDKEREMENDYILNRLDELGHDASPQEYRALIMDGMDAISSLRSRITELETDNQTAERQGYLDGDEGARDRTGRGGAGMSIPNRHQDFLKKIIEMAKEHGLSHISGVIQPSTLGPCGKSEFDPFHDQIKFSWYRGRHGEAATLSIETTLRAQIEV